MNLGDSELKSNSFSLGAINDRYWKFEPSSETQFTESQLPEIRAGWRSNVIKDSRGRFLGGTILNQVEHISALNNGHSKQAPKYFIEQVLLTIGILTP